MRKKANSILLSALIFTAMLSGCNDKDADKKKSKDESITESSISETTENISDNKADDTSTESISLDYSDFSLDKASVFSVRDLSGAYSEIDAEIHLDDNNITIDGNGVTEKDSEILIAEAGTYLFRGTLTDGRIIIDTDKQNKVQLVFDGVNITCSNSSPFYVKSADKVFLTLTENSENTLSDGKEYVYATEGENEPDAVIYSADDITINGKGRLAINANYNEGITSKNEIVISDSHISINSVGNAIKGKDSTAINSAVININSQKDGIKSSNTEETEKGFVYIKNSDITISSKEDGIQAESAVIADGDSKISIISGGGYTENTESHNDIFGGGKGFGGGKFNRNELQQESENTESQISAKGIKAKGYINIEGGDFEINSCDDTIHSNYNVNISDGNLILSSGDDAINADNKINITGGKIDVITSYEGIEAAFINISGGDTTVNATDDGLNASDGTAQGGMGTLSNVEANISGGTLHINSGGDGLDSNGTLTVTGGTVYVDGPENSGNSAIDGNGEILINSGTLIAVGSSGMVELPSEKSVQNIAVITLESYSDSGTAIKICDSDGNNVLEFTSAKKFNSIIASSPYFIKGNEYKVYINDTEIGSFTADEVISYVGTFSGMGDGFGGHHGGNFGGRFPDGEMPQMPEGMTPPDFENGEFPEGMIPPEFQNGEKPQRPDKPFGKHPTTE